MVPRALLVGDGLPASPLGRDRADARGRRSPGSRRVAAVAGLLWGLATLTRELSLYLVPIAVLWLLPAPLPGGRGAPRIQDSRSDPSRGSRSRERAGGRPVDDPQRHRLPRVRARLDDGRSQPLAGQRDAHPPPDLRGARHEGRGGSRGTALPRDGLADDRDRQPAGSPRSSPADARVLESGQRGARPPDGAGGLRPAAAAGVPPVELLLALPYLVVLALVPPRPRECASRTARGCS